MTNEEQLQEENVETATTETGTTTEENKENVENESVNNKEEVVENKNPQQQLLKTPRTFTQEQVNEFVSQRLDKIYRKFGVEDSLGLDEIVERNIAYNRLHDDYKQRGETIAKLNKELAYLKNNIDPTRYADIEAYFKGKELEFTSEQLATELATHPEWLKKVAQDETPKTTVTPISANRGSEEKMTEREQAEKLWGMKFVG